MAISKTQNERPAIIALIELANSLEEASTQHAQSIATLNGDVTALDLLTSAHSRSIEQHTQSISDLTGNVDTLTRSQSAISASVQGISDELGSGFDSTNTVAIVTGIEKWLQSFEGVSLADTIDQLSQALAALNSFAERVKIGETETLTVPANDSYSSSLVFPEPFTDGDGCIVFLQVITSELPTIFTTTLTGCTYSGFSYSISNADADAHTVKLGYAAFRTNGN